VMWSSTAEAICITRQRRSCCCRTCRCQWRWSRNTSTEIHSTVSNSSTILQI